jgi:hypothetical protein
MTALIESVSRAVPTTITEFITVGRAIKKRRRTCRSTSTTQHARRARLDAAVVNP